MELKSSAWRTNSPGPTTMATHDLFHTTAIERLSLSSLASHETSCRAAVAAWLFSCLPSIAIRSARMRRNPA